MRGVAGSGSSPFCEHHSQNVRQWRSYCSAVLSSCAEAASRSAVPPPDQLPTLSCSHANAEPAEGRRLSLCRAGAL